MRVFGAAAKGDELDHFSPYECTDGHRPVGRLQACLTVFILGFVLLARMSQEVVASAARTGRKKSQTCPRGLSVCIFLRLYINQGCERNVKGSFCIARAAEESTNGSVGREPGSSSLQTVFGFWHDMC